MHAPGWTQNPKVWRRFHLLMTCVWALAIIPSLPWWKDSILWIILLSVWANLASHFAAWQGGRAEEEG